MRSVSGGMEKELTRQTKLPGRAESLLGSVVMSLKHSSSPGPVLFASAIRCWVQAQNSQRVGFKQAWCVASKYKEGRDKGRS